METKKIKSIIKSTILCLFILIPLVFTIIFVKSDFDVTRFLNYFNSLGSSLKIMLFLFSVLSASISFPSVVSIIVTAILLDYFTAVFIIYIGMVTGSIICFVFIRLLGKDFIESKFVKLNSVERYKSRIESNGFISMLMIRSIVLIPFELVNFAAGLSKIKLKDYFFATVIGILPGILVSVYFIKNMNDFKSTNFIIASLALIILILSPLLSKKIRRYLNLA